MKPKWPFNIQFVLSVINFVICLHVALLAVNMNQTGVKWCRHFKSISNFGSFE